MEECTSRQRSNRRGSNQEREREELAIDAAPSECAADVGAQRVDRNLGDGVPPDADADSSRHRAASPAWASLSAAGLGVLVACLAAFALIEPPPTPPGPARVWVVDRDASRVYGLDAALYVSRSFAVDWPLDIEPAADGGLWVLRAETPSASATHRLDRFDAAGTLRSELWIERVSDLDVLHEGDHAVVVEVRANVPSRLVRVDSDGAVFPLLERVGLTCVCGEHSTAVVAASDGSVLRVDARTGVVRSSADIGGSIVDLARGPTADSVWALDGAGTGRVVLLADDLSIRWSVDLPRSAHALAPIRGEERVWLACSNEPCVVRFGPNGVLELDACGLPLPGLGRALAWRRGVLVCAVGAVLNVGAAGQLSPGQGGFEHAVDLAPVGGLVVSFGGD